MRADLFAGLMLASWILAPLSPLVSADDDLAFPLRAERILFLGDSITHADQYVSLIETQLRLQGLDPLPEIVNLGLSSETCSGLSEPGHPFPRPDVHERLRRALEAVRPDVVVACYGMNDGIYHPFDENRFVAFRDGIDGLVRDVRDAGARLVLMTPPPFDPVPLQGSGKLLPAGRDRYGYDAVYENYDSVIRRYADWLLGRTDLPPPDADLVIDLYGPISEHLAAMRQRDPRYTLSGDGVHPDATGHQVIAETILRAWGVASWGEPSADLRQLMFRRGRLLHDAWLSHVGHERPGVQPGLPLEEALAQAETLTTEIESLVRETRRPQVRRRPSFGGTVHETSFPASLAEGELRLGVDFFLWIPSGVGQLRGVIVHQHGCGPGASIGGRTAADDLHWQALAREWDCALLGSSYEPREGVNCRLWCDARRGSERRFLQALDRFAEASGHAELAAVPWCLWGHSGGAFWASLMQTLHPERVVAVWLRSGTAYGYWARGEIPAPEVSAAALAVPVMCNPGLKERDHERFRNAWDGTLAMFREYRGRGAPIGFAPDPNTAHECGESRYLAIPYFDACLRARLPDPGSPESGLRPIDPAAGWLAEPLSSTPHPAEDYPGDPRQAVWLPSKTVARAWSEYVATGIVSDDTPPPAPTNVRLNTIGDGRVRLSWDAQADLQSGLREFVVLRDGRDRIASTPEQPQNPFGRPLFQGMSYHDTPVEPLTEMTIKLPAETADGHALHVVSVNAAGLHSEPSEAARQDPAR